MSSSKIHHLLVDSTGPFVFPSLCTAKSGGRDDSRTGEESRRRGGSQPVKLESVQLSLLLEEEGGCYFFSLITFLKLGFKYGMEWSLKLEGVGGYGILEDWNGMRI